MNEIQRSISSIIKGYTIYLVTTIASVIISMTLVFTALAATLISVEHYDASAISDLNVFTLFSGMIFYLLIVLAAMAVVIYALFMIYNNLKKLSTQLDPIGNAAVNKLSIAALISIISTLLSIIPFGGAFLALGGMIAALVLNFMGYSELRTSTLLNEEGHEGAKKLFSSIVFYLIMIGCILIPIIGWLAIPVFAVLYWVYLFKGWSLLRNSLATLKCEIPNALSDNQ